MKINGHQTTLHGLSLNFFLWCDKRLFPSHTKKYSRKENFSCSKSTNNKERLGHSNLVS